MFITIEGGDGSGKSTLVQGLTPHFDLITREPGGCPFSEKLRKWLLEEPMSEDAETLLFLAARAEHLEEVIRPALSEHKRILCDRFHDSTIAYQGYGRGLGRERIEKLCNLASRDLEPDLTLYLDIDPKIGLFRLKTNDRLESEELAFHERVREGYLALASDYPDRIRILDATQPIETILAEAEKHL